MSQYPGGQQPPPPNDPYYGQPPAGDPYAQPQGQDPYYGTPPPADPYAPPPDPYYGAGDGFETVLDICEAACRGLLRHIRESHQL